MINMKDIKIFFSCYNVLGLIFTSFFLSAFLDQLDAQTDKSIDKKVLEIYVSPDAKLNGEGTKEKPFSDLYQARQHIRKQLKSELTRDIIIYLREGNHYLEKAFELNHLDSGNKKYKITYTSFPLERAVINGGKRITGWKEKKDGSWIVEIPEVKEGEWYFRQLFLNGERRTRAQMPNKGEGSFYLTGRVDTTSRQALINRKAFRFKPGDIKDSWTNLNDVEVLKFFGWNETRLLISEVDEKKSIVHFSGLSSRKAGRPFDWWGDRYIIENVFEGLDSPGEWYLNRKTGILHYIPMPGEKIEESKFIAPVAPQLIKINGNPEEKTYVKNIEFKDLVFMYSGDCFPEEGLTEIQSDVFVPGAFHVVGGKNIKIKNNHFSHLGTYCIDLGAGCINNSIIANRMHDLGGGGIKVGDEYTIYEEEKMQTLGNTITDNLIYDAGHIYLSGAGIWVGHSNNNLVAHNEIHSILGNGISVGWKWRDTLTPAHHNIIEYNYIHHIGNSDIGGGSGIYTLARQPGTVIRNNLIHDLVRYKEEDASKDRKSHPCFGLQLDRGSSEITFENNVIYNVTDNIYKQRGAENVVRNNIFAFSEDYVVVRRNRNQGPLFFSHNIVLSNNGKIIGEGWDVENYAIDYNLYWDISEKEGKFCGDSFKKWQDRDNDLNSLYVNPLFTDPENGDFSLKQGSPAEKIGFKPIDLSTVGPRIKKFKRQ